MSVLKATVRKLVPGERRRQWHHLRHHLKDVGLSRHCPCCGAWVRKFEPFGLVPREDAKCPRCKSLERHRLVVLYMKQRTDLFDGRHKKMLHIAPEPQLGMLFQSPEYIDYTSADLSCPTAMVKMDITDIQYPNNSFDVIYCSHVLEHVTDDRKAMREFHRVLKPGGWAILQVPITAETTYEDPSVTSPEERERLFGQWDHVRRYGPDYKERLEEAGFAVKVDGFVRELSERRTRRLGVVRSEDIYYCTKVDGS